MHTDALARQVSTKKGPKSRGIGRRDLPEFHSRYHGWNLDQVAAEQERVPGNHPHVSSPKPPRIVHGMSPSQAAALAKHHAALGRDPTGRKIRIDANIALSGVLSYPVPWSEVRASPHEMRRYERWRGRAVKFLQKDFGVTLRSVVQHDDEPYPHLHYWVVDDLAPNSGFGVGRVHPGVKAERGLDKDAAPKERKEAYVAAMRDFQDRFYCAVSARSGHLRSGPRRERLSRAEYNARQEVAMQLAELFEAIEQEQEKLRVAWHHLEEARQAHRVLVERTSDWQSRTRTYEQDVRRQQQDARNAQEQAEEAKRDAEARQANVDGMKARAEALQAQMLEVRQTAAAAKDEAAREKQARKKAEDEGRQELAKYRGALAVESVVRGLANGELQVRTSYDGEAPFLKPTVANDGRRKRLLATTRLGGAVVLRALGVVLNDQKVTPSVAKLLAPKAASGTLKNLKNAPIIGSGRPEHRS